MISIRGPPRSQGLRGSKGDTGPQSPKCDIDDKEILGVMKRLQWLLISIWLIVK